MRLLFVGDVFGDVGRRVLADHLPSIREEFAVDVCVANGENTAGGRGMTVPLARKFRKFGVNCITGGNHSPAQPEIFSDEKCNDWVLRPHNMAGIKVGSGVAVLPVGDAQLAVINLMGRTFIRGRHKCPFKTVDELLAELPEDVTHILVDFHAEATSEKVCMAHHLSGRVSAVVGTHTHVQTNDARIFPGGTGFLTDAGMTGPENSAIGMDIGPVLDRIITGTNSQFVQSKEGPMFNGVLFDLDSNGHCTAVEPIIRRYEMLH